MSDLIERLRFPVSMSMFATKTDLYMEILQQRKEAADALEARDKTIEELVDVLKAVKYLLEDLEVQMKFKFGTLDRVISVISQAQSKDKAE